MSLMPFRKIELSPEKSKNGDLLFPLQREMSRVMDEFFSNLPSEPAEFKLPWVATPAVNLSESDKSYRVTAELPGIHEKDIEVSLRENTLQIKGAKELSHEDKENGFITMERSYGSFFRSISFWTPVDSSRIKAVLKDGVLTIDVPKAPEALKSAKKVPVQKN